VATKPSEKKVRADLKKAGVAPSVINSLVNQAKKTGEGLSNNEAKYLVQQAQAGVYQGVNKIDPKAALGTLETRLAATRSAAAPVVANPNDINNNGIPDDVEAAQMQADAARRAQEAARSAQQQLIEDQTRQARQKASDVLRGQFEAVGLGELSDFIDQEIMAGTQETSLLLKLYEQPVYKQRFPGMEALRAKGRAITESAYVALEKQYEQTARLFELPQGFYDDRDTFGRLISNEVSAKEFQDRLQTAQDLTTESNQEVATALREFYGTSTGELTAYFLDPDKALPIIQKQARAAEIAGYARRVGFGVSQTEAEALAENPFYQKLTDIERQQQFSAAAEFNRQQQRLAALEGETFTQQEALQAVVEQDVDVLMASQKRAEREKARFRGSAGVSQVSLAQRTAGQF